MERILIPNFEKKIKVAIQTSKDDEFTSLPNIGSACSNNFISPTGPYNLRDTFFSHPKFYFQIRTKKNKERARESLLMFSTKVASCSFFFSF